MITCRINKLSGEVIEHKEACHPSLKSFGSAYFKESSLENLTIWNNKPALRKYYSKKIVSANNPIICHRDYFKTSTKYLKSLKIEYLNNDQVTALESNQPFTNKNFQFKKAMLASRRIKRLTVKNTLTDQSLRSIKYLVALRCLKSLDISVSDQELPTITKVIHRLKGLKSIRVLFQNDDRHFRTNFNPYHFLGFCEEVLAQKDLRIFNIDFDNSLGRYPTEAFEKIFELLEGSEIERWNICAMLAEDQVLRMAEKYRVFREADSLLIHPKSIIYYRINGITEQYLLDIGYSRKMLNIYLQESLEDRDVLFDLESVARQCPKLEYFNFSLRKNLPYTVRNDEYSNFDSLRSMNFDILLSKIENNLPYLLKILANSPYLERFSLVTNIGKYGKDLDWETEANALRSCANILTKIKTLKSIKFKIFGLSQESLEILRDLLQTFQGLKELEFTLRFSSTRGFLVPKIPFDRLTELTHLQLWLPYSPESYFQDLSNSISKLNALWIVKLKNRGEKPLHWKFVEILMKKMWELPELRQFSLESSIKFDVPHNDDVEKTMIIIKEEVVSLASHCQTLESIEITDRSTTVIKYRKSL